MNKSRDTIIKKAAEIFLAAIFYIHLLFKKIAKFEPRIGFDVVDRICAWMFTVYIKRRMTFPSDHRSSKR
jgi:hypothetical protein